jgi:hypothetical protein
VFIGYTQIHWLYANILILAIKITNVTKEHLLPKRVWEVCELSEDLKKDNLDYSKFAVEFFSVLLGKAPSIYQDAELFLKKTFLSNNMRYILVEIIKRLLSGEGKPALVLSTEFGGGKTHTLLLIYHLLTNKIKGLEYLKKYEIDKELELSEIPDIKIVSYDMDGVSLIERYCDKCLISGNENKKETA